MFARNEYSESISIYLIKPLITRKKKLNKSSFRLVD